MSAAMDALRFMFTDELQSQDLLCKGMLVLACILWLKLFPQLRRIRVSLDKVSSRDVEHQRRFRSTLVERMESSSQITHALDHLLHDLGCDRAYVFQYHNGGENVAGIPFAKCSVTHERVRGGTESRILTWQNLPISLFSCLTKELAEKREIYIEGPGKSDACSDQIARVFDTISQYFIGLYSFDGLPVGFVGIDYCYSQRSLELRDTCRLKASAFKICGLLLGERGAK
jgi:hypothetical protein